MIHSHTWIGLNTLCLKNVPFYILENSAKNEPISIIFGYRKVAEISHHNIVNSPIVNSPTSTE